MLKEEITVGSGPAVRSIAIRHRDRAAGTQATMPGFVWLGGYRSDMEGSKAVALDHMAGEIGAACTRFDYSGHGASGGKFVDGTISRWLEESLAVFDHVTSGAQILVGSSMGAWIALKVVETLSRRGQSHRVAGLLLIAPAPDFTSDLMEPALTEEQRRDLDTKGFYEEPTPYGPEPNVYTRQLFEDGHENRVLTGPITTHCPVHIIQGMADPDVPYAHALKLAEHLGGDSVVMTLIGDGDHRLSRPRDIALILRTARDLAAIT